MKIAELRSEFSVYIVDADFATVESFITVIKSAGYDTRYYPTTDSALAGIRELPPHLLVFNHEAFQDGTETFLDGVRAISPEILTLLLVNAKQVIPALQLIEKGLTYDYLVRPFVSSLDLIQKLDRAAQRLYFQFETEQLREEVGGNGVADFSAPEATAPVPMRVNESAALDRQSVVKPEVLERFLSSMLTTKDLEQTIQTFLDTVSAQLHNVPALYFKYIPHYLSLVLSHSSWLPIEKIRGIGVELKSIDPVELPKAFNDPSAMLPLKTLLQDAFKADAWSAVTHYNDTDIQGVFVFFDRLGSEARAQEIKVYRQIFDLAYRRNLTLKEKHTMEIHDALTGLYNRKQFRVKLDEEITRARRISMPLSMIVLEIDRYQDINRSIGFSNAETVLKMVSALLKKTTRINDIIGRLGNDEIAIILPHTDHMGAAVKAERIRRFLESTRFPALAGKSIDHVTVSIGVSEYPSFSNDADGLVKSADEALFQVKEAGGNRVCLATPSPGFVPDFKPRPVIDAIKEREREKT